MADETLSGVGLFDQGFLTDYYDDAGFGDVVAAFVGFEVVADFGSLGKADVAVDDGAADARVATDIDVIVEDGFLHFAETVHANVISQDGMLDPSTGNDGAGGDDGIDSGRVRLVPSAGGELDSYVELEGAPDLVVEIESPLEIFNRIPSGLPDVLEAQYLELASFQGIGPASPDVAYDQQDAFYAPFHGSAHVKRPGPTVRIFGRRHD